MADTTRWPINPLSNKRIYHKPAAIIAIKRLNPKTLLKQEEDTRRSNNEQRRTHEKRGEGINGWQPSILTESRMKRHRYGHGTTEEHGNLSRLLCATFYVQKRTKGCLSREGRLACVCVHPLPDNRKVNRRTCTTQTLSSSKLVDIERERERERWSRGSRLLYPVQFHNR